VERRMKAVREAARSEPELKRGGGIFFEGTVS
jgi:hypothetical protein